MIEHKVFSHKWLSDGIGENYKIWTCKDRQKTLTSATCVLIESPTGTGKTSFVLDKLFPFAAQNGRNILYLGNRAALKAQTEYAVEHRFIERDREYENSYTKELNSAKLFYYPQTNCSITILNYQAFMGFSSQYLHGENPFYYIILDEAHFFLEDSLFNPMTAMILNKIMQSFSNSVLVFMSATIGETADILINTLRVYRDSHPQQIPFQALYKEEFVIYQNLLDRRNYNIRFFNKQTDIIAEISNTPLDEKWLIFVTSKQAATKIAEDIRRKTKSSVVFLSAEKKKGRLWDTLINDSYYEERVLIVTKVLDNGVNIIDSQVKHIVLPFCDRVDFLQMLGRKRIQESESVHLYVTVPSIQAINSQLHRVIEMKGALSEVIQIYNHIQKDMQLINNAEQILKDQKKELSKQQKAEIYSYKLQYEKAVSAYYRELTALLQKHWLDGKQYINSLFYLNEYRNLVPNYIAYEKLLQLESFYSDLKENAANPNYWQFTVLNWLQSNNSRPEHLTMENHESLEEFLRYHTDNPVPEAEQEAFYNEFQHLYKQHCYELFGNNKTELKASLGIRKGKTQRKATMNKSLALLNLPYEVKKEKNCWVLRQKLH